ncbi:MAG: hypothetical protein WAW37_16560 [Syntrophobacteraceae bacterium]
MPKRIANHREFKQPDTPVGAACSREERAMAKDAGFRDNAPDFNREFVALARPSRLQAAPTALFRVSCTVVRNTHLDHATLGNSPRRPRHDGMSL